MQQVMDKIEALVCELYYEASEAKERKRIVTCHIVIALLEKAVAVIRMTLG